MRDQFTTQMQMMHSELTAMGTLCEQAIASAVNGLLKADPALSKQAIELDEQIDQKERVIENMCMRLLLHQQPVARDLRQISSALKMITDLERIADQAADISEISLRFGDEKFIKEPEHIAEMARCAIAMVKDSVQSYINRDVAAARDLDNRDDRVDILFETIKKDLVELIRRDPSNADQAILFMMVAKYLERIGDHAVNIGEWVDYAVTGHHN